MTSFFLPKPPTPRQRIICNGGLGGLVDIGLGGLNMEDTELGGSATWPRRKNRRPPALSVVCGNEVSQLGPLEGEQARIRECDTPKTPSSLPVVDSLKALTNKGFEGLMSPLLSRYNTSSCVYYSLPPTPTTLESAHNISSTLTELPGSLLLPSQGFPQNNPPTTPPRHIALRRRLTDESSDVSSVPSLTVSPDSETDDTIMLKTFSSPKRKAARLARAVESTLISDSSSDRSLVAKPMSSMNVEELLQRLPGLSLNVVNHVWLPAMQNEFTRIKALLQDAAELKLETHYQLSNFGEDLMAVSNDARKVSFTYEKALRSAESLLERDSRACYERLETSETNLEIALTELQKMKDAAYQKDQKISGLQQTIDMIVRELGSFIHDNLGHSIQDTIDPRSETVMQIIADYSFINGRIDFPTTARYLRLTEETYLSDSAKLSAAQAKILQYQELAWDHSNVIKSQSSELDERLRRYEQCIDTIKERNHEILLLVEQDEKSQNLIDNYENGMCVGQSTRVVQERLLKQNDDMDRAIESMKLDHAKQLEDRDAEIENLRQKLGSAREEVLARKADVKNVITHTQALLSPLEPSAEMAFGGFTAKERKLLAKERAKKGPLPNSMSMTSLPFFASSRIDLTAALEDNRHSDKEIVTAVSKIPRMVARIEKPEWACGIQKKRSFPDLRRADDSLPDLAPRPRKDSLGAVANEPGPSRTDSLGVVANYMRTFGLDTLAPTDFSNSSINTHKELPNPPLNAPDIDLYHDAQGAYHGTLRRPQTPEMLLPDYVNVAVHKRVLSNIPEISSIATSDSEKDISSSISMTSSDREAYKKSLDALNLIEFMKEGDLRSPRDRRRVVPQADYESWGYDEHDGEGEVLETGVAKAVRVGDAKGIGKKNGVLVDDDEESPTRTVSEMYHSGRRKDRH